MRFKISLGVLALVALLASSREAAAADFTVTATGFTAYTINAAANPTLTLTRGHTYTFDVNTPGHPFFIKTAQVTGTGSTFDTGVTNNGPTAGTLTFTVPASAPATLFYQCSVHAAMTGTLAIVSAPVPASSGVTRGLTVGLLAALALVAVGRARRSLMRWQPTA
jgi:hypothetical protein